MPAWLATLNNDTLSDKTQWTWAEGKGLKVWNANKGPPPILDWWCGEDIDVVIVTSTCLQKSDSWVTKIRWHTVIADEAHSFLRGQHNKRADDQSITLNTWSRLQTHTKSMFIISGTPFVTKITFDFIAITKSIASNWRDVTAGDGSIGPKWIPKPELKS